MATTTRKEKQKTPNGSSNKKKLNSVKVKHLTATIKLYPIKAIKR
jgi:hypothetical protein